ncbi:MAG: hypothetical protein ACRC33_15375, partial [Gemmataceae bacterium]
MRVLINGQAAVGARTGVGHYTAELARCLQSGAGADEVVCFQPDWLAGAKQSLSWLRDRIDDPRAASGPSAGDRSFRLSWRQWVLWQIKQAGLRVSDDRLRAMSRRG